MTLNSSSSFLHPRSCFYTDHIDTSGGHLVTDDSASTEKKFQQAWAAVSVWIPLDASLCQELVIFLDNTEIWHYLRLHTTSGEPQIEQPTFFLSSYC